MFRNSQLYQEGDIEEIKTYSTNVPDINPKFKVGLIKRVCLSLEHTDPGRLLSLLRSLFELPSQIIQMKINRYLADVTKSDVCFMVMCFLEQKQPRITVLGENLLPQDLVVKEESELMQTLRQEEKHGYDIPVEVLTDELKESMNNCLTGLPKYQDVETVPLTMISVPVRHPVTEKTLMYMLLINTDQIIDFRRVSSVLVSECMRYCASLVMNAERVRVTKSDHERARNYIEMMRLILINIDDTSEMLNQIELGVCDLLDAEWCSILLKNECGQFVSKILNYGERIDMAEEPMKDVVLPAEYGLASIAAETGQVVNCLDTHADPRYCNNLDDKMPSIPKTVICFPLKSGKDVIGVVEAYNKLNTTFTEDDERTCEALSVILSPIMMNNFNSKKLKENVQRRDIIDDIYIKDQIEDDVDEVLKCNQVHEYREILNLNYSQYDMTQDHFTCILYDFFHRLNVIKRFDIRPVTLVRFLLSIFKEHCEFPYHNWRHSFSTFHYMVVLINELNLVYDGYCTMIEVLALLLASLCHCVSYRGAIHKFEFSCGTTLAALYSSPGHVNQVHQSSQIFRLLNNPRTNILENIPAEEFEIFARLFKKLVNAADMGYFSERMNIMTDSLKSFDKDNLDDRVHLLQVLMTCSVLSDYAKDFMHSRKTAELTFAEFLPVVDMSHAKGVFDMTQFEKRSIELIPHLQTQFIATFCLPTFKILSEMFPVTHQCVERCQENLAKWKAYEDKFQDIMLQEELDRQMAAENVLQDDENQIQDEPPY